MTNDTLEIKIKKTHPDAITPNFAHEGDAGMDLYSVEEIVIKPGETKLIPTGITIQLKEYTEAQIRSRSGLALKHSITVLNSPGTIDAGYRGEIGVILINHGKQDFKVEKGMKIAQMVIKPTYKIIIEEVSEVDNSVRGTGGFGSTGLK